MKLQEFDLLYTCQNVVKGYIIANIFTTTPRDENSNKNELVELVEQCEDKT